MKPLDLIILLLTIFLSACQDKQKEIITLLVKEWQGKQILFPENMVFTRFASDTTNFVIPTSDYKVLVFVDSIGCTSCKLQLSRWKEFIRYTDSISQKNIPFLFFFQFDDQWEIHSLLIRENFDKPICLDRSDSLNQLNHFPKDIRFQVFLLDKKPAIIFMDELEISLHIRWQREIIDRMRQINPFCQIIIATHSPSMFGTGWGDKVVYMEDIIK